MFENFQEPVNKVLQEQGIKRPAKLFTPPSEELGDFCFVVNQVAGRNDPIEIAEQLQEPLKEIQGIDSVTVFNAGNEKKKIIYLNFSISEEEKGSIQTKLITEVLEKVTSDQYGHLTDNKGKSVIVEHTSANPISPIHVGNLRNSVQGDTFARILEHSGYDVYVHYYVNDVGLQIGFVVVGYELATQKLGIKPPIKIDLWSGQIYAIMNCFYTIQKLKKAAIERGTDVEENYKITSSEAEVMVETIENVLTKMEPRIAELADIEKPDRDDRIELKELKISNNKLNDEISDIAKYQETFDDLHQRFPELFEPLYEATSEFDLQERVSEYLKAYESNGDERITNLFRDIGGWVLQAFEWTLRRYNIEFDEFDWESDVTWSGLPTKIIDQLGQIEHATVDGQAVRYSYTSKAMKEFLKSTGLTKKDLAIRGQVPDLQLRRTDGTALYAAKDIAYSIQKFEKRNPEKVYNVISSEQALPQFQMLLPLHQLGHTKYAANLHHYSYELVELLGRTMSGRLAKYITADEYYDETYIRARMAKRTADAERDIALPESREEWTAENEILRAVTLASTRFPLIETVPRKRIELDLDRELDFRRNAGPFVQYAHARANSLLEKVAEERDWDTKEIIDHSLLADYEIVEICNHLDSLDDLIRLAITEQDPSKIASWVVDLAQYFMKFYEKFPVMKAESQDVGKARLAIVRAIKKGIATGLTMLGIPAAARL